MYVRALTLTYPYLQRINRSIEEGDIQMYGYSTYKHRILELEIPKLIMNQMMNLIQKVKFLFYCNYYCRVDITANSVVIILQLPKEQSHHYWVPIFNFFLITFVAFHLKKGMNEQTSSSSGDWRKQLR
jgi:hypothetical protein